MRKDILKEFDKVFPAAKKGTTDSLGLPYSGETFIRKSSVKQFLSQALSTIREETLSEVGEYVKDDLQLLGITHAGNYMKGSWLSVQDLLKYLAKLKTKGG